MSCSEILVWANEYKSNISSWTVTVKESHLSDSLAVVPSRSHITCWQVIASPQDGRSHSQVYPSLWLLLLSVRWGFVGVQPFRRKAVKPSNCRNEGGKKTLIYQNNSTKPYLNIQQKIDECFTAKENVLTKVKMLVNIIMNRVWSWRPHYRLAVSGITVEFATWKQRLCDPEYTIQTKTVTPKKSRKCAHTHTHTLWKTNT